PAQRLCLARSERHSPLGGLGRCPWRFLSADLSALSAGAATAQCGGSAHSALACTVPPWAFAHSQILTHGRPLPGFSSHTWAPFLMRCSTSARSAGDSCSGRGCTLKLAFAKAFGSRSST